MKVINELIKRLQEVGFSVDFQHVQQSRAIISRIVAKKEDRS
jgi:hypothetical protein